MAISHFALADLCRRIYATADGWLNYWIIDDVVVGHTKIDDADVIVLRGSVTAEDWARDADAMPEWHPQLGYCHAGFLAGMDSVFAKVKIAVGGKVIITGHSLGGARARILAGLFAVNGIPVDTVCTFGSPKPAFPNLARIIEKAGITHVSYRNRNDPVPMMPLTIALLADFVHTEQWIAVNSAPDKSDLTPLRDHSISLYCTALA